MPHDPSTIDDILEWSNEEIIQIFKTMYIPSETLSLISALQEYLAETNDDNQRQMNVVAAIALRIHVRGHARGSEDSRRWSRSRGGVI